MTKSIHTAESARTARIPTCTSCGSVHQRDFSGEIAIHFPGLKNIDKPTVFVFPKLLICLNCGSAVFAVPETELSVLAKDDDTAA